MAKLKIAFVWNWGEAKRWAPLLHDGLIAAMRLIGQKHKVDWFLGEDRPRKQYDWILSWGVGSELFHHTIEKYKCKKGLLCAGHPHDLENINKFDFVFVESPEVYRQMKPHCKKIDIAFGTDTDFFRPEKFEKTIDAVYPATFSPWKRQSLFAEALGSKGLACGFIQPDGQNEYEACLERKVYTLSGVVPTALVARLYSLSKTCVITAWHGSERTALEAMACNLPIVITKDNQLTCSLLTESAEIVEPEVESIKEGFNNAIKKKVNTRDYVLKKYSHNIYAQKILDVVESS